MAELYPAPFANLLKRMFVEYEREGKIFDLSKRKFYKADVSLDTSVRMHGHPASSPLGPAAGPQDQMAQNIVLAWLAGSRILELKTVQINDELKIPRPCIDVHNIGFNIEWSQELKLEQSLHEYVAGSMLIDVLKSSGMADVEGSSEKTQTIFDMSVGYDLAGISTPRVRNWIESMKDASPVVKELRRQIPAEFKRLRDLNFNTRLSDTLTLSTFHGCPAHEIESIVDFLLREMGLHVIIKLNPTLLGKAAVDHLLHDVMGYHEIQTEQEFFDKDLQFDQAIEICSRLDQTARSLGRKLGVKFSNTLVVLNNNNFLPSSERVMYLSGQPLHVITLNLVKKWRHAVGNAYPISFSAGVDAQNFCNTVAMNFTPVTTCTDLLRPGGYGRLPNYLYKLEAKMKEMGVSDLGEFILYYEGNGLRALDRLTAPDGRVIAGRPDSRPILTQEVIPPFAITLRESLERRAPTRDLIGKHVQSLGSQYGADRVKEDLPRFYAELIAEAGLLNTESIVDRTTRDERYYAKNNRSTPRKIGSHLYLFDCINCDKCVPVCPNDANFVYETESCSLDYLNYRLTTGGLLAVPGGHFEVKGAHQLATFQDFCNECGNCDVFCPEDGGPYVEKPRLFGSAAAFEKWTSHDGFLVEAGQHVKRVRARLYGNEFFLEVEPLGDRARFRTEYADVEFEYSTRRPLSHRLFENVEEAVIDMQNYLTMNSVLRGVLNPKYVNYLNVGGIPVGAKRMK
ncbi:MAG: glutamate synthase [Terriglobia bacterium]